MRTLRSKYLSDIPIEEVNYKADFIILEKYQAFSSEILRLSLLGLAIYGFFIADVILKITNNNTYIFLKPFLNNKVLFIIGAIALLITALCALGHRYFSTDCMTHFVRRFRLRKKLSELKATKSEDIDETSKMIIDIENKINRENESFERDLNKCKWLLSFSCIFLILGVGFVIAGLGKTLNDAAISLE